jgi:hypothetical protein
VVMPLVVVKAVDVDVADVEVAVAAVVLGVTARAEALSGMSCL